MELTSWIRNQYRGIRRTFDSNVATSVPRELWTKRPDEEGNSIAWLMWHMARTQDVAINSIVRGVEQVLTREGWLAKIGIDDSRIGTGLGDEEVAEFGMKVDVDAVDGYWLAVSEDTGAWLDHLAPEQLDEVPDLESRIGTDPQLIDPQARALVGFWGGKKVGFFIGAPVIVHGYMHLGEMYTIAGRLGYRAGI